MGTVITGTWRTARQPDLLPKGSYIPSKDRGLRLPLTAVQCRLAELSRLEEILRAAHDWSVHHTARVNLWVGQILRRSGPIEVLCSISMTTMRPPASEQKVNSPAYRSGIFLLLVAIGLALYWHTQEPSVSAGHLPAHTGAKSTAKDGQYDRPGGEQQAFCSCGSRAEDDEGLAFLQLEGTVEDCCCDYSSITKMNRDVIRPALEPVVKEPFFR